MSLTQSSKIVTDGLVLYYDMDNKAKSFTGIPTTNLSAGFGIGTYLNTPSDVTSVLTLTDEFYKGSPVYKQVLTPITATGVSYLTNANNPGIGVVTSGGGGAAARYTGHSIFFKPAVGRSGLNSSTPIYTHYSNISGWQSTGNYDDMGDGWYRAHVIYYNSSGGSDGKYWAINPAGAALNIPITIFWAGPFKEDRNDSTFVSPYVTTARSTTDAIKDLTGNNTITANSLTYSASGEFSFNGSGNNLSIGSFSGYSTNITCEAWFRTTSGATWKNIVCGPTNDVIFTVNGGLLNFGCQGSTPIPHANYSTTTVNTGAWFHGAATYDGSSVKIYVNGKLESTNSRTGSITSGAKNIGSNSGGSSEYFNGTIDNVKIYNRVLSALEIQQNFNALRGRFENYVPLFLNTISGTVTVSRNGSGDLDMFKTSGSAAWDSQAYSTESFTAPCTIEFNKIAGINTDNGQSYAMIGWNTDPAADASYTSIDYAHYVYRSDLYEVYNNGGYAFGQFITFDINKKFYVVYDTDGYIRHYNGNTLLYTSPFYGTGNIVYLDSSFYSVNSTYGGFKNVKVIRKSWNGQQYV